MLSVTCRERCEHKGEGGVCRESLRTSLHTPRSKGQGLVEVVPGRIHVNGHRPRDPGWCIVPIDGSDSSKSQAEFSENI